MLLSEPLRSFVEKAPVSVMTAAILERVFDPQTLERVFEENAQLQYTHELTFGQVVKIMSDVVYRATPSVNAWYATHGKELSVRRAAVYDKLNGLELPIGAALVRHSADTLLPCLQALPNPPAPLLTGYRVRVLDGNHLAGTEHRIFETRRLRAAVLPGQALVFYDPRYDLMDAIVPCENAHAQERSLLDQALALVAKDDCIVADRNFCTTGFLFGLRRRAAYFVIRQHSSTLHATLRGERRLVGADADGRNLYEQDLFLSEPATGETMTVRRVTIELLKPTQAGEMEIHILTNLPTTVNAFSVADLYARRWTIEAGFQQLTVDLECEIDTLGYPRAALFGFSVAVLAYNVVSLVKNALRAAWGEEYVAEKLSTYYVTLEVATVTPGLRIAVAAEVWSEFCTMSVPEFAALLLKLAQGIDKDKYAKHKRGPKKQTPKKTSGKRQKHHATAKLLAPSD